MTSKISRRDLIRLTGAGGAALLIAACGGQAQAPASAPAPAAASKPAASVSAGPASAASAKPAASASAKPAASASGSAAAAAGPEVSQLYEAAKKEGKVVWWTAYYAQSAADAAAAAFKAKYPGVEIEYIRQTAQVVYQRLTQDLKANVHELDVFSSTDFSHYPTLKKQGALMPYKPAGVGTLPKDLQQLDPEEAYQLGSLGFVVINYNTNKVKDPPKKWTDLLDAKWKDQVTLGHPGFSGFVGNWVVAMSQKYGWDYLQKLAKNNPKIGRSINDTVTDEVSGEREVGAGPDNLSLEEKSKGNPVDIYFPDDDAILIVSPVAIMKDAPHPNAAKLLENFLYSPEYSQAMVKTFNFPLNPSVKPANGKGLSDVKYTRVSPEALDKGVPEAIQKWREIFNV
ncbi:MAG TPA: extracellular solute-binding protein [Chloroflexota bacterium]|nr:extracellular solute-binding protein [Chloroflexota bacterium]